MLTVNITFKTNRNQGSFLLDTLAEMLQGNWNSRSSTPNSGTITNIPNENRQAVNALLSTHEYVESFEIEG